MPIKVLIVDDVPDLRWLFRETLSQDEAFEVVGEAVDGHDAIAKAAALRPDLVLLDLAMPGLDGLSALPSIHAACPGTRVLIVSGFESEQLSREAISRCASDFLEKGISLGELLETARRVGQAPPKRCAQGAF